jgi:hypothetical protein
MRLVVAAGYTIGSAEPFIFVIFNQGTRFRGNISKHLRRIARHLMRINLSLEKLAT